MGMLRRDFRHTWNQRAGGSLTPVATTATCNPPTPVADLLTEQTVRGTHGRRQCTRAPTRSCAAHAWRLVPLILAMYIAAFLNRVNVGFAALTMNHDLGFSPEVYGWGTGIFFLGYLVFEVPSNLIMERVGARLWLSRIMITWALVSMAFAFVQGPVSFFAAALPAGPGGGRLLSRHPALFHLLVSRRHAGAHPGAVLRAAFRCPTSSARRCRAGCWGSKAMACMAGSGCTSWKAFPPWRWASLAWWGLPDNPAKAVS